MAAGSHAEKGIWALLVNLARTNKISIHPSIPFGKRLSKLKFHLPIILNIPTLYKISTSPTRLERAVKRPALKDFLL